MNWYQKNVKMYELQMDYFPKNKKVLKTKMFRKEIILSKKNHVTLPSATLLIGNSTIRNFQKLQRMLYSRERYVQGSLRGKKKIF